MNRYNPRKDTQRKHYIDKDVYTAAKERLHDAITLSDNQVVLYSGGKDSGVCLHLLRECYKELGKQDQKINVIFMDEEVIHESIVQSINRIKDDPQYNLYWFNIPITCDIYNTGKTREYIQNDPNRPHVREPPRDAITLEKLGLPNDKILTRYELKNIQANLFKGKVCLIKGIRTDESLFRLTQVIRRKNSPHIGAQTKKHFECVPIYDWTERDVFLYYYKNKKEYNNIYNHQMYAGTPLRVSTPLHAYNRKQYNKMRSIDPKFYEQIVEVFPDLAHKDRYDNTKTETKPFTQYPHNIHGLMQYIEACYPEKMEQNRVKKKILWAYKKREKNKKRKGSDKFGGYPLYYLYRIVQRGATMRNIIPSEKPSLKMYEYEGYTPEDQNNDNKIRETYNK